MVKPNRPNAITPSELEFLPANPREYQPEIGLIGCGGITVEHLSAYRKAGYLVTAVCDIRREHAERRAMEYFPKATIFTDHRELLKVPSIQVVDVATHPQDRADIIRDCLMAGKHVLSQKPFVLDLDEGERLVELAVQRDLYLAVNQNGRWAPHYRYASAAIEAGLLGEVFAAHLACHWDHTWVKGTEFEKIRHLILYDYAIHWFDIVRCFLRGREATRVFASTARKGGQVLKPNLLAQVLIEFDSAQSTLVFDADVPFGQLDTTFLAGTEGTILSSGPSIQDQQLHLHLKSGSWTPQLEGRWFPDGFHGTMGELLCAIEDRRTCSIAASDNLQSLALCFAALQSADTGLPVKPGSVRRLPA